MTGSDRLLSITYFGYTTFVLESKEIKILLNPGIWNDTPVVPDDFIPRVVIATNSADDAIGNAATIAVNSKAWFLGNKEAAEKATEQGVKPWLLHVLEAEVPYEIPDVRITPYALARINEDTGARMENLGLIIEMGGMKVGYLGDTTIRGPFEQLEMDILIAPIGGKVTFPVKDAVSLCIDAKPRIGIPMRWTADDQPIKFSKYVEQFGQGTKPVVMEPNQVLTVQWAAGNEFRYELN
ncbi:MAG: MBL fold metallo-hydrolase [Candidatus Thorarchaeota archaeon]|nr:MBL fold metallo-hydrolase [Candidatus Thorarchaeota archaeon]